MTPGQMNVLRSLVVLAWADGQVQEPETSVIDGLLSAFDATEEEEAEILEFARHRRTLVEDLPLDRLGPDERELLLANAALLTHADGDQSDRERNLLSRLAEMLGYGPEEAARILDENAG